MAAEQNKENSSAGFLIQGSILAAAGIVVRLIGLAYRIPLIRIIGDEGMGYYSVAYEVYSVILLISSYSLPLAVSKMISARLAEADYVNSHRILKLAFLYATAVGALGCIFVACSADWFANVFYQLPLCKYALLTLAPTIWIMAYLGVARGYYQGQSTMVPTAVSQILEQIVNALVSVGAAWLLCNRALAEARGQSVACAWGAAGGTIGTGAGAVTALLVLILLFLKGRKDWYRNVNRSAEQGIARESYGFLSKVFLLTVIPVLVSTGVYNISGIIDAELFSSGMISLGTEATEIASQYGAFTGKFKTVINIPVAISNSLSSSLVPVMSAAVVAGNRKKVHEGITNALRFTVIIALPASIGLMILGGPVISLLFRTDGMAGQMMTIGSFAVLLYSISTVTNAILQGNSYMRYTVTNSMIALILHIGVLQFLLKVLRLGIFSVVLAYLFFGLSMCLLNAYTMRTKIGYRHELVQIFGKPLLCALVMGVATYGAHRLLEQILPFQNLITLICIAIALLIYGGMVVFTGCITREELRRFPIIGKYVS